MKTLNSLFPFQDALIPNLSAWVYILFTYVFGFAAIMAHSILLNALGVILLAHSMIISAYFIHECAMIHFLKKRHNRFFGILPCGSWHFLQYLRSDKI